jgi:putative endonuclease
MAYLYIVECDGGKQNTYYTGIAKDICQRLKAHGEKGKPCAKYTRAHAVVALRALWETENMSTAAKGEYAVKKLTREKKEALIAQPERLKDFCLSLADLPFKVRRDIAFPDCLNKKR